MPRFAQVAFLAATVAVLPFPLAAQAPDSLGPPVAFAVIDGLYARPVGEFHQHVKHGGGFDLGIVWPPRVDGPIAFRADLGVVIYGSEKQDICFSGGSGCRVQLDMTTTNSILFLHVGPHLMIPRGPLRPYGHLGIGISLFSTTSELKGTNQSEPFASTTNQDDFTFSWLGGAGLNIPFGRGPGAAMLDLGVRYVASGEVEYLKKGDIHDNPDGPPTITPTRSEANLLSFRVGIAIPIRMPVEP